MVTSVALLAAAWGVAGLIAWQVSLVQRKARPDVAGARKAGLSSRGSLGAALGRTRAAFSGRVRAALGRDDSESRGELERLLIESDLGVRVTRRLLEALPSGQHDIEVQLLALRAQLLEVLQGSPGNPEDAGLDRSPWVCLVVGVNGAGKTTTIGKLARESVRRGQSVLLVAADTFRAAAGEQLEVWAQRTGAGIVRHQEGSDPSAVVHDGLTAARAREVDVVYVDTAGRLHTRANLMEELAKIVRVTGRVIPGAPHAVLLVLDATTGQNGLAQAKEFARAAGITGIALTKLDGSARGGIALAIREELGTPIRWVGVGEGPDDLLPFDPEVFVDELLGGIR